MPTYRLATVVLIDELLLQEASYFHGDESDRKNAAKTSYTVRLLYLSEQRTDDIA